MHRFVLLCIKPGWFRPPRQLDASAVSIRTIPKENTVKIIITVTGIDHEGIIAAVTTALAERKVNVLDVSQTIMGEYFTMIMHCSFNKDEQNLIDLQEAMVGVEREQRVQIRIQAESIFKAMHTL